MVVKAFEFNKPELLKLFFKRQLKNCGYTESIISQALLCSAIDKYPKHKENSLMAMELLKNSAMKVVIDRQGKDGNIPMNLAVQKRNPELINDLLHKFDPDLNRKDYQGRGV